MGRTRAGLRPGAPLNSEAPSAPAHNRARARNPSPPPPPPDPPPTRRSCTPPEVRRRLVFRAVLKKIMFVVFLFRRVFRGYFLIAISDPIFVLV